MTNQTANPSGESWRLADRWRNTRPVLGDAVQATSVVVAGIVGACVIGYAWPRQNASTAIAIAGVVLQWAGLAVVAVGIAKIRRHFDRPSLFRRFWEALQRPRDVTVQLSGVIAVSASGTLTAVHTRANPTTQERVTALEAALSQLRSDLNAQMQTINTSVEAVKQDVQREAATRASAITAVRSQFADVAAGGLRLEIIGLWWLVVAALLSSVPNELAALLPPF